MTNLEIRDMVGPIVATLLSILVVVAVAVLIILVVVAVAGLIGGRDALSENMKLCQSAFGPYASADGLLPKDKSLGPYCKYPNPASPTGYSYAYATPLGQGGGLPP